MHADLCIAHFVEVPAENKPRTTDVCLTSCLRKKRTHPIPKSTASNPLAVALPLANTEAQLTHLPCLVGPSQSMEPAQRSSLQRTLVFQEPRGADCTFVLGVVFLRAPVSVISPRRSRTNKRRTRTRRAALGAAFGQKDGTNRVDLKGNWNQLCQMYSCCGRGCGINKASGMRHITPNVLWLVESFFQVVYWPLFKFCTILCGPMCLPTESFDFEGELATSCRRRKVQGFY